MQQRFLNSLLLVFLVLAFTHCANRGTPSGGDKDVTPPVITKSIPENYATQFKGKEIQIYFDEYVKLKNISKQLIVSPPMKTAPLITPAGSASKSITIKIFDTLHPNTTYAFNFGNSIVDNNEENPYSYYRYVFSTGDFIDSLSVNGTVRDALNFAADDYVTVALYEADSSYTDSIIYKQTPKYISNTLDSTNAFSIKNLKAGRYFLRALKDENSDNKFQQDSDKIGFYEQAISIPEDSASYELKLFKENLNYRASKPRLVSGEKIAFGYQGDYKTMNIELLSEVPSDYKAQYFKDEKSDTLNYYYRPKLTQDSLIFKISNKTIIDTFTVKIKDNLRDSLVVKASPIGSIRYKQDFSLSGNIPFETLDNSKISIMDKDSLYISFTSNYNTLENKYNLSFDKTEENTYKIEVLPEALTDLFGNTNDSLSYTLRTQAKSSYGNVRIKLINAVYPVIVQFTNERGDVKYEQYITASRPIDFQNIDANKYYIRTIFDANKNGIYDTGNYLKQKQAERVSYYPELKEVKAGWDETLDFTLLD